MTNTNVTNGHATTPPSAEASPAPARRIFSCLRSTPLLAALGGVALGLVAGCGQDASGPGAWNMNEGTAPTADATNATAPTAGTGTNGTTPAGTGQNPSSTGPDTSSLPPDATIDDQGNVIDGNGNPVVDGNGNPVVVPTPTGTTDPTTAAPTATSTPTAPSVTTPPGELADCSTPGPRQVRRLSAEQYYRTLQSIFGDSNVPQETVLSNPSVLGFHVDSKAAVVRDLEGELLMNYAESVADWAVTNNKVAQYTTCTNQEAQCQKDFIAKFGAKAHRAPLSDATVTAYQSLFTNEATFADGQRVVVSAMLQSPYTLYRREMGEQQGGEYALTPYEIASQLSYWLTDGPPDAQLYDAAANNRLSTNDDFIREASRLLDTEYARETMAKFVEGWLEVDKLHSKAKNESLLPLPADLRNSMVEETHQFFLNTFYEGGTLADLFTADHSYIDQALATHYGLAGGGGSGFQRVELANTDRPTGMLGQAAFLTTHALSDNSSPVQRAKIVIERLLCGTLPAVPSNLNVTLDTTTQFKTNRERYEVHRTNTDCSGCHQNMDPIGYAFEHYDGFGHYRAQENGVDVDASGSLAYLASGPVALDGVDSLSDVLAESPEVQSCLVRYWSYFTFGAEGWANSQCNRDSVIRYAQGQDFSLKSVLLGIVQAPNFAHRVAD